MPQKTNAIDKNLENLIFSLKSSKFDSALIRGDNGGGVPWLRPSLADSEWDGGLRSADDLKKISKAFNTDEARSSLKDAFDLNSPGNSSDGIVLPLQIYYAQQAERAYRARACSSFARSVAHLKGRETGHGFARSPLEQAVSYFSSIIRQGAEKGGS